VVLAAVGQCGWALEYASDELRNERDVVLEAVGAGRRGASPLGGPDSVRWFTVRLLARGVQA
jgi:hypothetical protein